MSDVPLGKQMQDVARKRRLELRQLDMDGRLDNLPESDAKRRRAALLHTHVPELVVKIFEQIRVEAETDGAVSMTICRKFQPLGRHTAKQACCFYLSKRHDSKEVFRCDVEDEEYVVATIIEALIVEQFSVDLYPPTPKSPMPLLRIDWFNLT